MWRLLCLHRPTHEHTDMHPLPQWDSKLRPPTVHSAYLTATQLSLSVSSGAASSSSWLRHSKTTESAEIDKSTGQRRKTRRHGASISTLQHSGVVEVQFHVFSLWTYIFCYVSLCRLIGGCQRFGETSWFQLQRQSEREGSNREGRQQIPPNRQYPSAKTRRMPGDSNLMFTIVKTSLSAYECL